MMPMVDGFATLEQIKKTNGCDIARSFFSQQKNKEKDIKRTFVRTNLCDKALFDKKLVEQVQELIR
jgi:CheY-like chemotaxis protein